MEDNKQKRYEKPKMPRSPLFWVLVALLGLLLIFTQQAAAFATGEETILSGETQTSQTAAAPLADGFLYDCEAD